jgi:hypothetical protein
MIGPLLKREQRVGEALASPIKGDLPPPKRSRLREARASAGVGRSCRQAEVALTHPISPHPSGERGEMRDVLFHNFVMNVDLLVLEQTLFNHIIRNKPRNLVPRRKNSYFTIFNAD